MQTATHQEAVGALRNAGSCIKMKVLRERLLHPEVCDLEEPQYSQDVTGRQQRSQDGGGQIMESAEDCLSKKIEAVVCNGNGIVGGVLKSQHKQNYFLNDSHQSVFCLFVFQCDLEDDLNRTLSKLEAEALIKNDSPEEEKHTMTVSRSFLNIYMYIYYLPDYLTLKSPFQIQNSCNIQLCSKVI